MKKNPKQFPKKIHTVLPKKVNKTYKNTKLQMSCTLTAQSFLSLTTSLLENRGPISRKNFCCRGQKSWNFKICILDFSL